MKNRYRNTDRRDERIKSAKARQAASDLLTPAQRLERLDKAFGVGMGAAKERKRLQKMLDKAKTP